MSQFPDAGYLSSSARSQGEQKAALEAFLAACKQLPGGLAESKLTIATGAVTPLAAAHNIDTEGAAASDDLSNIVQTNLPDGSRLMIRAADASRVVTVKHGAGGTGQILLTGSADVALNATTKWLLLKRTGSAWEEVGRMGFSEAVPDATDAVKGIVELSTDAEAITGTDATRAVTPAALTARMGADEAISGAKTFVDGKLKAAGATSGATTIKAAAVAGTTTSTLPDADSILASEHIRQVSKSEAYTCVLADAGKHIYHPSADTTARTWTIPANASVAYLVGTTLTFVNDSSAGTITIAITTDTLVLAGDGATGSRTLAANGVATALKVTSTRWIISGNGLT